MRGTRIFVLAVAVLAAACGKAPTEVSIQNFTATPTPTQPLMVEVAGTWTGTMTYLTRSDRVTVSIEQDGPSVQATWSTPARGEIRFDGLFLLGSTRPDLAGTVTFSHPLHCEMGPIKVRGEPTQSGMALKGSGLYCLDPAPFSLELLKAGPR